jgi:uncharacterized membrane protein
MGPASSAILAVALSFGLVSAASADQNSATITGQAVTGQSLNDTQSSPFSAFASQSASDSHGNPLAFQQIVASTRSTFDPRNIAFTEAVNSLSPGANAGTSFALTTATATFQDMITINGPAADIGKVVRLSNVMTLINDNTQHSQEFNAATAAAGASLTNQVEVHVTGAGVGAGAYGGSLFGFFDSTFTPGHTETTNGPTVDGVGFQMDFVIGTPTPISITLQEIANSVLADPNGHAGELATLFYTYALEWGDNTQITLLDRQGQNTGVTPRGLSVGSANGFDFFDGTTGGAAGVPEPATWALMISGFGMAAGMLRRRRSLQPG